jgi:hypothetical protein
MRLSTALCLIALSACADATHVPPIEHPPVAQPEPVPPETSDFTVSDARIDGALEPDAAFTGFGDAGIDAEAPQPADVDGDGVPDEDDNCQTNPNPDQIDLDADGVGDACDPCVAEEEVCNGRDDNCNGWIDEDLRNACGECGPVPDEVCDGVDNDCDGRSDEGVLNACGACGEVPSEICDGVDDDCDGRIDEGLLNACGTCGPVPSETCNGEDDDCDGSADEGFGLGLACSTGQGSCQAMGRVVCGVDGGVRCDALPGDPIPEMCDGDDNDCDGRADEGVLNACGGCGLVPDEVCDAIDNDCDGNTDEGLLNACGACGPVPEETCDDVDNDCDGRTDEDAVDANACGVCGPLPAERCDGTDNDCDGNTDEGLLNVCGTCGAVPAEKCNGIDDDCDGHTDEGFANGTFCATGQGECRRIGTYRCTVDGSDVWCDGGFMAGQPERCDGLDNDCDGDTDEDAQDANACGICGPAPVEACDGEDNDCDGRVDEDFDVGGECMGGIGALCSVEGRTVCGDDGGTQCIPNALDLGRCLYRFERSIAVGDRFSCVIVQGQLKCFGRSPDAALGHTFGRGNGPQNAARPVPSIDLGMDIREISAGDNLLCAHDRRHNLKCIGSNVWGQLGLGRWELSLPDWPVDARPFIDLAMQVEDVSMGGGNTCVTGFNQLKCWGQNRDGRLGNGIPGALGDHPDEMGVALPHVELGIFVHRASVGSRSQCAVVWSHDGNSLKCWGSNARGQLGLGLPDEGIVGDSADEMGFGLPFVDIGMEPISVASGTDRHCAVGRRLGQVKCWGARYYPDQPGGGHGSAPEDMGNALPAIPLDFPAMRIVSGPQTACALGAEGELACWGRDYLTGQRRAPRRVDLGMPVITVALSHTHACALGGNGDVKCWGENADGQLGTGDAVNRAATPHLPAIDLF